MKKVIIFWFSFLVGDGCCPSQITTSGPVIQIEWSTSGSSLNTFEGIYSRDQGDKDKVSIPFQFTPDEQQRILRIVDSVNFWQIPDDSLRYIESLKQPEGIGAPTKYPDPGPTKLRIKTASHDKTISMIWYENFDFNNMLYILNAIDSILVERPEYKKLPSGAQRW